MEEVKQATNETITAVTIPGLLAELDISGFDYLKVWRCAGGPPENSRTAFTVIFSVWIV